MGAIISVSFIVVFILGTVFGLFFFWKIPFQVAKEIKIEYDCPPTADDDGKVEKVLTQTTDQDSVKRQSILTKNPLITIDNRVSVVGGVGYNNNDSKQLSIEDKLEGNLDHSSESATSSTDKKELKFDIFFRQLALMWMSVKKTLTLVVKENVSTLRVVSNAAVQSVMFFLQMVR